jgi:NADH dehydrogenase FAD-containing subunit
LREYAESKFKRDGVKVKGNSKITAVGPDWLELEGEGRGEWTYAFTGAALMSVPYGLLVWSTGLSPNPFIDNLTGVSKDEKTHSSVSLDMRKSYANIAVFTSVHIYRF